MKIGIMTFHRAWNYGAVLQAYALQQAIQSRGHDCEIIDYRNECIENTYTLWPHMQLSPKGCFREIANVPVKMKRKAVFESFRNTFLKVSPMYTKENIEHANEEYDGFLLGSDQIWNHALTGADMNYLGAYISQDYKRNSYAASFGERDIAEEYIEEYRNELSKFNKIAVREKSAEKRILELTQKTALNVLDPVFLLDKKAWQEIDTKKKAPYPYIFVYQLQGDNTQTLRYAQYLAKQTGLKLIEFQAWPNLKRKKTKPIYAGHPKTFLSLMQNAEFVVTDSFHCTAFSIILEKQFWARINPIKEVFRTRVGNLLQELNLQERILPEELERWKYNEQINFSSAKERLEKEICKSQQYIDAVLGDLQAKQE